MTLKLIDSDSLIALRKTIVFHIWIVFASAHNEKQFVYCSNYCLTQFAKYGGPQLSHQNQMLTANYKSLTSNSNRSQQIQIAHSKLQIIDSGRRLRLSTARGATRLKIYVIHEAATL